MQWMVLGFTEPPPWTVPCTSQAMQVPRAHNNGLEQLLTNSLESSLPGDKALELQSPNLDPSSVR